MPPRWFPRPEPLLCQGPTARASHPETAAHPIRTPAACRSSPAPFPSPYCSRALPREGVALDLLVQIGSRHVERARGLAHVPVMLPQLRQEKRALRGLLELLERL